MSVMHEAIRYAGMGWFGLPDPSAAELDNETRAQLYFKWGGQSNQKDDYYQCLKAYKEVPDENMDSPRLLKKYKLSLSALLELLKLELKDAVNWFDFLCSNRMRIEIREISFANELNVKIGSFLHVEEDLQVQFDGVCKAYTDIELEKDGDRDSRKRCLEEMVKQHKGICQGLDAFYHRVQEYVRKGELRREVKWGSPLKTSS